MTVEERHRKLYLTLAVSAVNPPSLVKLARSKLVVYIVYLWSWVPICLCASQVAAIVVFIVLHQPGAKLVLALARRFALMTHSFFKLFWGVFRIANIQNIYDVWNKDQVLGLHMKRREESLDNLIRKQRGIILYAIIVMCCSPFLLVVRSIRDPYGPGSSLAYFPHNTTAPYHMLLLVLENAVNTFSFSNLSCDIIRVHMLLMLSVQIQTLTDTLRDILVSLPEKVETKENSAVQQQLKVWLRAHQRTIRWSNEIRCLFAPELTNKYIFMGVYASSAVFSMPGWLKEGNLSSFLVILLYGSGYFSFLFIMTRKIDEITQMSQRIFEKAYGTNWHHLSLNNQKTLQIIGFYCTRRPIQFYAFGLYRDCISFYFEILVLTYRMLSFVLQIEDT